MSSPFDGLQQLCYNTATTVFGFIATWAPSAGGVTRTANVLKREPTSEVDLVGFNYTPQIYIMEYKDGDFPGLKTSCNTGGNEAVTIDGVIYDVKKVDAIWDGKTLKAILEKKL